MSRPLRFPAPQTGHRYALTSSQGTVTTANSLAMIGKLFNEFVEHTKSYRDNTVEVSADDFSLNGKSMIVTCDGVASYSYVTYN